MKTKKHGIIFLTHLVKMITACYFISYSNVIPTEIYV